MDLDIYVEEHWLLVTTLIDVEKVGHMETYSTQL